MPISSPFIHQAKSTKVVMLTVILALIPGAAIQTSFFGFGVLINLFFCGLFALLAESFVLYLRKRDILATLQDNSALLTGLLLGLAFPPTLPLWMSLIGVSFAIIFAKQLYGGLGFNPFNPAMIGYALLLISFPIEMTTWLPPENIAANTPSIKESLELMLFSQNVNSLQTGILNINDFKTLVDGSTMATPLDVMKTEHRLAKMTSEIMSQPSFQLNLLAWQWVNLGFLLGGLFLIINKTIRWHIPASFLISLFLTSSFLYWYDNELYNSGWFHLTSGATMLGAFFIATDPVSAATTPKGRIIYGASIGFLIVVIRTFGGYPEAVAFSVLLLNLAAPTIDHYTKPVIYGHQSK